MSVAPSPVPHRAVPARGSARFRFRNFSRWLLAASTLAIFACGGEKPAPRTGCYDTSRQCVKVCDETEQNASAASVGCRDTCNGSYKAGVAVCADTSDADRRKACMTKSDQDFGDCLKGCQDTFEKARQDAIQCRNTCVDQLERCTTGK